MTYCYLFLTVGICYDLIVYYHVPYQQTSERMELQDKLRTDLLQNTELSEEEVGWHNINIINMFKEKRVKMFISFSPKM